MSNSGFISGGLSGVAGGVGTGASLGSVIPGVGTLIGGAVGGLVGGAFGALSGKRNDKAAKYARLAQEVQKQREYNVMYNQQLQYIRDVRMQRAESLLAAANADVSSGSLSQGALSSIGSQSAYSLQTQAEDTRLAELYNTYAQKAGKLAGQASKIQSIYDTINTGLTAYAAQRQSDLLEDQKKREQAAKAGASQTNKLLGLQEKYLNTLTTLAGVKDADPLTLREGQVDPAVLKRKTLGYELDFYRSQIQNFQSLFGGAQ